jgi:hypothetical protein
VSVTQRISGIGHGQEYFKAKDIRLSEKDVRLGVLFFSAG